MMFLTDAAVGGASRDTSLLNSFFFLIPKGAYETKTIFGVSSQISATKKRKLSII